MPAQLASTSRRSFASTLAMHLRDEAETVLAAYEEAAAAAPALPALPNNASAAQPPPAARPAHSAPGDKANAVVKLSAVRRLEAGPSAGGEGTSPKQVRSAPLFTASVPFQSADFPALAAAAPKAMGRRIAPTALPGVAVGMQKPVSAPVATAAAAAHTSPIHVPLMPAPQQQPSNGALMRTRSGEASLLAEEERAALREARKAAQAKSSAPAEFGTGELSLPLTPRHEVSTPRLRRISLGDGHAGSASSEAFAEPPQSPATPLFAVFSSMSVSTAGGQSVAGSGPAPMYAAPANLSPGDTSLDTLPPAREASPRTVAGAQLMSAVLRRGLSPVSLGTDIVLIARLLAIPPTAPVPRRLCASGSSGEQLPKTLTDGDECAAYAAMVLTHCFAVLVPGLGERLLSALGECPQLRRHARATARMATVTAAELRTQAQACRRHAAGAPSTVSGSSAPPGRLGLELEAAIDARRGSGAAAASSAQAGAPFSHQRPEIGPAAAAHAEEQAFHNRERARDALYDILEDLAGHQVGSAFTGLQKAGLVGAFGSGTPAVIAQEQAALAARARELLARLRPDNTGWLACLLAARALAAATQGETDEVVGNLAGGRTDRLQRLHARITSDAASSSTPFKSGNAPSQNGAAAAALQNGTRNMLRPTPQQGGGQARGGASSSAAPSSSLPHASVALLCPVPLRPFVLFLEAADSARLNAALTTTLLGALRELDENVAAPPPSTTARSQRVDADTGRRQRADEDTGVRVPPTSSANVTDRVLALRAIGTLLGVLNFGPMVQCTHGSRSGTVDGTTSLSITSAGMPPLPVDCAAALKRAVETGTLTRTAPWVLSFLALLPWAPQQAQALTSRFGDEDDIATTLRRLAALAAGAWCRVVRPAGSADSGTPPSLRSPPQGEGNEKAMSVGTLCVAAACGAFFDDWTARWVQSNGVACAPPPTMALMLESGGSGQDSFSALSSSPSSIADIAMAAVTAPNGSAGSAGNRGGAAVDDAVDACSAVLDDRFTDAVCPALGEATRLLTRSTAATWAALHGGGGGASSPSQSNSVFSSGGGMLVSQQHATHTASRRITALPPRPSRESVTSAGGIGGSAFGGGGGDPTAAALRAAFWASHAELRRLSDIVTDAVARSCAAQCSNTAPHTTGNDTQVPLRDAAVQRAKHALDALVASCVVDGKQLSVPPPGPSAAGPRPAGFDAAVERIAVDSARAAATSVAHAAAALARVRAPQALAAMLAQDDSPKMLMSTQRVQQPSQDAALAAAAVLSGGALGVASALVADAAASAAYARVMSVHANEAADSVRKAARKMLTTATAAAAAAAASTVHDSARNATPGGQEQIAAEEAGAGAAAEESGATGLAALASGDAWHIPAASHWRDLSTASCVDISSCANVIAAVAAASDVPQLRLALASLAPQQLPVQTATPAEEVVALLLCTLLTPPPGFTRAAVPPPWMSTRYLPARVWTAIAAKAVQLLRLDAQLHKGKVAAALFAPQPMWLPALRLACTCPELAYRVRCGAPALVLALLWNWDADGAEPAANASTPQRVLLDASVLDEVACAWLVDALANAGAGGSALAQEAIRECLDGAGPGGVGTAAALLPRLVLAMTSASG